MTPRRHGFRPAARLGRWLRHAFAVADAGPALGPEDEALIERVARWIVERRLAAAAALFLEGYRPLAFLGSQALLLAEPVVELALQAFPGLTRHLDAGDYERFTRLLERRDAARRLVQAVERAEEAARGPRG
ncbi:MAG: hypothetical protein JXQ29_00550 [Planctomycetes bacterium]|nr:hypothetical protein [Planctomycetota bacterium]